MKTKLIIGLVMAVLLVVLLPSAAFAAKPVTFSAGGIITAISDGTVYPAGGSGRWRVAERELSGLISGDISGDFTLYYKANIESVNTQAGNIHGRMTVGDYVLNVNGKSEPIESVGMYGDYPLFRLTMSGHWNFLEDTTGVGSFDAWAIFVPTPDGHVAFIVASEFAMTGQWQP